MTGKWKVGEMVKVASRTWAGINKPGGCAKITKLHYHDDGNTLRGYDVKYVVGSGGEKELDPALVFPFETLQRGGRSRRGRDFLTLTSQEKDKENDSGPNGKPVGAGTSNRVEEVRKKKKRTMDSTNNNNSNKKSKGNNKKQKRGKQPQAQIPPAEGAEASPATTSPSTPESSKPKVAAKKVTPIPSYVIAGHDVDVSPLERLEDANVAASSSRTCRRGLFDSEDDNNNQDVAVKASHAAKKDKKPNAKVCTTPPHNSKTTGPIHHPSKSSKNGAQSLKTKPQGEAKADVVAVAAATLVAPAKQMVAKSWSLAKKSTLATKKNIVASKPKPTSTLLFGKQRHGKTSLLGTKKAGGGPKILSEELAQSSQRFESTSKLSSSAALNQPILSFPRPKSSEAKVIPTGTSVPLQGVFADEMDRATKFVQEVMGPRASDIVGETSGTAKAVGSLPPADVVVQRIDIQKSLRYKQFLAVFRALRMKLEEDGSIEENQLVKVVNEMSPKEIEAFSKEEVDCHIKALSDQGKIMKSDGMIYWWDE